MQEQQEFLVRHTDADNAEGQGDASTAQVWLTTLIFTLEEYSPRRAKSPTSFDSFQTAFDFEPTKVLSPARSHLSGLCGQRLQQLVLHELALLFTLLQRDTYMSSTGTAPALSRPQARDGQTLKPPAPQGV